MITYQHFPRALLASVSSPKQWVSPIYMGLTNTEVLKKKLLAAMSLITNRHWFLHNFARMTVLYLTLFMNLKGDQFTIYNSKDLN